MAPPLPLPLKPQPQTLTRTLASIPSRRPFSSSSIDSDPVASETKEPATPSPPPPRSSYSSLFSDIKDHLKSPPSPPRRIPQNPSPPPPPLPPPAGSLDDIRKHLAEFRLRSPNPNPNPNNRRSSSPNPVPSFQQLFRDNAVKNDPNPSSGGGPLSFDSIRENLRKFRSSPNHPPNFRSQVSYKPTSSNPLVGDQEKLQDLIFGNEAGKEKEGEAKTLNTEFVRIYSYDELGEKLRRLRPEAAEKGGKDWFSLEELNLRLAKLRELEETESAMGGVSFRVLRESLTKLKEGEKKHANMQKLSMLVNIGLPSTPSFMLKPPQEQLLENYFHPDHMSSAEKMKLELKKVRDEFKMSESDCGSARVQVAQLTTKIKHLSSVLHKKDKHSRKGLHDMVQRRKKLLKYLRRTDWDSYCFVLSKLGLRDVPEYKTPDYKS